MKGFPAPTQAGCEGNTPGWGRLYVRTWGCIRNISVRCMISFDKHIIIGLNRLNLIIPHIMRGGRREGMGEAGMGA